jgi:hypothetical protein
MKLDPINPQATFRYTGPYICIDGHAFILGNAVTVRTRSTIMKLLKRDDFVLVEKPVEKPAPAPVVEPEKPQPVITRKRKKATYL